MNKTLLLNPNCKNKINSHSNSKRTRSKTNRPENFRIRKPVVRIRSQADTSLTLAVPRRTAVHQRSANQQVTH